MLRTVLQELADAIELIKEQKHEDALLILNRLVAFDSSNEAVYSWWVLCHVEMGRYKRALELAEAGLARGMNNVQIHVARSMAHGWLLQWEEAIAASYAALAIDPHSREAVHTLVTAELGRENLEGALEAHRVAHQHHPDDQDLLLGYLRVASQLRRHRLAIDLAREYLRKFGKDVEVLTFLGNAYVETRDLQRAAKAYADSAAIDPDAVDPHVHVLMLAKLTGNNRAFDLYIHGLEKRKPGLAAQVMARIEAQMERFKNPSLDADA
jgi:tetratricopeptide (TPR) repeat protein